MKLKRRAPENINRDSTWDILMVQDGVDTDAIPLSIDRDHGCGPQNGGRRRVKAATYPVGRGIGIHYSVS